MYYLFNQYFFTFAFQVKLLASCCYLHSDVFCAPYIVKAPYFVGFVNHSTLLSYQCETFMWKVQIYLKGSNLLSTSQSQQQTAFTLCTVYTPDQCFQVYQKLIGLPLSSKAACTPRLRSRQLSHFVPSIPQNLNQALDHNVQEYQKLFNCPGVQKQLSDLRKQHSLSSFALFCPWYSFVSVSDLPVITSAPLGVGC